jgi:histidyl-tRNA synthetase
MTGQMSKTERVLAVKGMNDVLPPESALVEWLESCACALFARYAYRNIRTPIVERTPLFVRGLGEVTDIVEKEMYSFEDHLNGDSLTLRPEATAGVVRAALEHNLLYDGGKRLYYMGPMFRHERPQKGRYRQFDQMGVEALGFDGAEIDAELILMALHLWRDIGLADIRLELNSLGQPDERLVHRVALIAWFERHNHILDEDARRRLYTNPLRILDSKNPNLQTMIEAAPRLIDFLGQASMAHLENLKAILDANNVAYTLNPRLVRGMDYYNLTVFEFVTDKLGAQGTVCAGGRYDGLFLQLGGKPTPAVGWALGVDRVLELLKTHAAPVLKTALDAYAIVGDMASLPRVMSVLQTLRGLGVRVQMHSSQGQVLSGIKSQFKRADASGANYALVFGTNELSANQVTIKPLREADATQITRSLDDVANWAATLQSAASPD